MPSSSAIGYSTEYRSADRTPRSMFDSHCALLPSLSAKTACDRPRRLRSIAMRSPIDTRPAAIRQLPGSAGRPPLAGLAETVEELDPFRPGHEWPPARVELLD